MTARLPAFALSVRAGSPPEGTDVAGAVTVEWPFAGFTVASVEPVVLFIHGYNNPHAEARYKYAIFRYLVHRLGVTTPVAEFHWPGNKRWGFLSFACYPLEIQPAIESGRKLAQWMQAAGPTARFLAITHSMGGRVLAEAVNELRRLGALDRLIGACLMAAAVRVDQVEDGTLGPHAGEAVRWRVLYSGADTVLHYAFPIGQTVGGDGFFPTAVGRAGDPEGVWDRAEAPGYDHGDYWFGGKPDDKVSDDQTQPLAAPLADTAPQGTGDGVSPVSVADFLGFAPPHALPAAPGPPTHELAASTLPAAALNGYQLAS